MTEGKHECNLQSSLVGVGTDFQVRLATEPAAFRICTDFRLVLVVTVDFAEQFVAFLTQIGSRVRRVSTCFYSELQDGLLALSAGEATCLRFLYFL